MVWDVAKIKSVTADNLQQTDSPEWIIIHDVGYLVRVGMIPCRGSTSFKSNVIYVSIFPAEIVIFNDIKLWFVQLAI